MFCEVEMQCMCQGFVAPPYLTIADLHISEKSLFVIAIILIKKY